MSDNKTKYQKELKEFQMKAFKSVTGRPIDSFMRGVRINKSKEKVASND